MSQPKPRILIADDEPNLREALRIQLERAEFEVILAVDGQDGVESALREQPDLVILDVMMPRLDGYAACRQLRSHYRTRHIPIIMLTAKTGEDDQVTGLSGGANDYIAKPWKSKELLLRVKNLLDLSKTQRSVSPLTGLPGNNSIMAERQRRVDAGDSFSQMFLDLDHFKAFNDRYGFPIGDVAIQAVAKTLVEVVESRGEPGDFVGHIGGDDFWVITMPDRSEELAEAIKSALDRRMPELYEEEDRTRGFVLVRNRRHEFEEFPLMSVTIVIADYDPKSGTHMAAVDDLLKELKTYGKGLTGSVVVTERRRQGTARSTAGDETEPEADAAAPAAPRPARGRKSNAA